MSPGAQRTWVMKQSWLAIPDHYPHVRLDEFVIMPNHVHGIIWIVDDSATATVSPNARATVPTSVGAKNLSPLRQGSPRISPPVMHTIPATASANVPATEPTSVGAKNLSPLRQGSPRISPPVMHTIPATASANVPATEPTSVGAKDFSPLPRL